MLPRGDLTRACAEGMMRNWVDQRIADLGEPVPEDLPWCPSGITANLRRWRRPGPVDAHVAVDELVFDPTDPTDVCRLDLTCWVDPPADERVCLPDQTMVGLAGAIPTQRQILPDPPEHHDPNPWGHQIWRTTSPPAGTDPLLQMCIAPVR
ncbi:MAG: hypothetical protein H6738_21590 [Alphaproteobacteria bacterium]|nr:hypothetical protein [Alphaproteobacteria bacterium]